MSAAEQMVAVERRVSDRRASLHVATAADRRGKSFSTHDIARLEVLLVEVQAAAQHAREQEAHAIAAGQTLMNALRHARAAVVAAERAAHLAAGAVSGATA